MTNPFGTKHKMHEEDFLAPVAEADGLKPPWESDMYAPGMPLHERLPKFARVLAADRAKREDEAIAEGLDEMRRDLTPTRRRSPSERIRVSIDLLMEEARRSLSTLGYVRFSDSVMREIFGAYWEAGYPLDDDTKLKIEEYARRTLEAAARRAGNDAVPEVSSPVPSTAA